MDDLIRQGGQDIEREEEEMRNKKVLLAILLLSLSFCFVSGVGWGITSPRLVVGDISGVEETITAQAEGFEELLEAKLQASQLPKRYTFLVFFINGKEELKSMLWNILGLYPEAEFPEEFTWILPSGMNSVDKMRKAVAIGGPRDFGIYSVSKELMLSLLLTMAYQQGYEIEHVTSSYMILQTFVDKEELKEWEERSNEYKEKGYK